MASLATEKRLAAQPLPAQPPLWFWLASGLGLAWNAYGLKQFVSSVTATRDRLVAEGMTGPQADLYASLPLWMNVAFAVGVIGGLVGCVLLLLRSRWALPVFGASLVGYVVLYIGDITQGVFALFGMQQVVILSVVVLIAALLLWLARHFQRRGSLV